MTTAADLQPCISAACPGASAFVGDPADRSTWGAVFTDGATDVQRQAVAQAIAGWSPSMPGRAVPFTALVDALSSSQYAAIDARDRDRMQSKAGGMVYFTWGEVRRAAAAIGMTPDELFKLAGA